LLLQFGSNHCRWRENAVFATAELNEFLAGHDPTIWPQVRSGIFVDLGQFVSVEELNCLSHHHTNVPVRLKDLYGAP
jgi:hypothetical protein